MSVTLIVDQKLSNSHLNDKIQSIDQKAVASFKIKMLSIRL